MCSECHGVGNCPICEDDEYKHTDHCEVCDEEVTGDYVSIEGGCYICEACVEVKMCDGDDCTYDEMIEYFTALCKAI